MDALVNASELSKILGKYNYSNILQVYFQRSEHSEVEVITEGLEELYEIDLDQLKAFLLNRPPEDKVLKQFISYT